MIGALHIKFIKMIMTIFIRYSVLVLKISRINFTFGRKILIAA